MANFVFFHNFKADVLKKVHDLDNDELKMALCTSTYSPNLATHDTYSDLTNELANASGYTTGGMVIPSTGITLVGGVAILDADDFFWTAAGGNIGPTRYGVVYNNTPVSKPLIGYLNFISDQTSASGTPFSIEWANTGIFRL